MEGQRAHGSVHTSDSWQEERKARRDKYVQHSKAWSSAQSDSGTAPGGSWTRAPPNDGQKAWENYQWPHTSQAKSGGGWGESED